MSFYDFHDRNEGWSFDLLIHAYLFSLFLRRTKLMSILHAGLEFSMYLSSVIFNDEAFGHDDIEVQAFSWL